MMNKTIGFELPQGMIAPVIDEGGRIPETLMFVDMSSKTLTGNDVIDPSVSDCGKKWNEAFYVTTINGVDYCAVGRCEIGLVSGTPTGNYEELDDVTWDKWVAFWPSAAFIPYFDLPKEVVV